MEETLRRLRNCSPDMTWEEKGMFLTEFAVEMYMSGHSESFRQMVMNKAVSRHSKELHDHLEGRADLYRSRETRAEQLKQRGGRADRENWFKRGGQKVTSILKVPMTDGGVLRSNVEEVVKKCPAPEGIKIRVQESNGVKLKHSLMRSDPFPRPSCERDECPLSTEENGCRERCHQCHCNYTITCKRCDEKVISDHRDDSAEQQGVRYQYRGESSRGCLTRFNQHADDYERCSGFMWQHTEEHHEGRKRSAREDYSMERVGVDNDSMRRVLREAVGIRRVQDKEDGVEFSIEEEGRRTQIPVATVLMNSKEEFHMPKIVGVHLSQQ